MSAKAFAPVLDMSCLLLSPAQAKGLEFDAVVVVSPGAFMVDRHDGGAGGRLLYVALTRAVQELTVVAPRDGTLAGRPRRRSGDVRRLVTSDHAATEPNRPDVTGASRGIGPRPSPGDLPMRAPPWHSSPGIGMRWPNWLTTSGEPPIRPTSLIRPPWTA